MKSQSLPLLSLLLAAQGLLVEGMLRPWRGRSSVSFWEPPISPSQYPSVQRSSQQEYLVTRQIITPDQAQCHLTMRESGEAVTLRVECTQMGHDFSCIFAGIPTSCPVYPENAVIYWRQISNSLSLQNNICANSGAVLSSRVCGSGFPESNLKLVFSTFWDHGNAMPTVHEGLTTQPITTEQTGTVPPTATEQTSARQPVTTEHATAVPPTHP
ncbi:fibroblast growth factor-binding protein 1-like [Erinaceus europaeus]|uniref:Fibroblast growth factor-binding protein 1-like n=1 Tax=Erinaceus europaeus TaxID=9365 RepID=A0ABM3X736_ERIEU|nr:fibroblast growth factor-binding protein 1-like [Erinaceus europaeus]